MKIITTLALSTLVIMTITSMYFGHGYKMQYEESLRISRSLEVKNDSVIKVLNKKYDSLSIVNDTVIKRFEEKMISLNQNTNEIDSLTNVVVNDSIINEALIWVESQQ